jgi:hypothetical protein
VNNKLKRKKCSVCDCSKNICFFEGVLYCPRHITQMKKHGKILNRTRFDPNEIIEYDDFAEIILYDRLGKELERATIDKEDIEKCKQYKWYRHKTNNKYYVFSRDKGTENSVRLHRFLLNLKQECVDVDHINGNTMDNRKKNLRICTRQENMMNQRVVPSNNKTGYIGVYFSNTYQKYIAQIKINKKNIHLGSSTQLSDAIQMRKNGELLYFGKNKFVNFEGDN